ncbi:SDR family NAD(P)-dependent oxidoreductase [Streptomyces sp. NPDC088789]|uniref:SDR family NAD(P)-dependent oxidoreductase n=1 Tax=Streptomyces sp. NPDC088789 TaxID=3365899 RepID=UPI003818B78B
MAAVNGPRSVVVSGSGAVVDEVVGRWEAGGGRARRLRVSHAFHSSLMEPMLEEFREVVRGLTYHAPHIPLVSNVTGGLMDAAVACDPEYWVRHVREPVRFAEGVGAARSAGVSVFVEVGPGAVLSVMGQECVPEESVTWVALSRGAGAPAAEVLLSGVGAVFAAGVGVDWGAVLAGAGGCRVGLPTYAFQRRRYWLEVSGAAGGPEGLGLGAFGHGLLGAAVTVAGADTTVLTGRITRSSHGWLADHEVKGRVLVPGAALVEMALRAGDESGCPVLEEFTLEAPLELPAAGGLQLQLTVEPFDEDENGRRGVEIYSRPDDDQARPYTRCATGRLAPHGKTPAGDWQGAWPPPGAQPVDLSGAYEELAERGYAYGPGFQGLTAVWRDGPVRCAEVTLPEEQTGSHGPDMFGLHPALLDAALHTLLVDSEHSDVRVPFAWTDVTLHATGAVQLRAVVREMDEDTVAVTLYDGEGGLVAEIGELTLRTLTPAAAPAATDHLYTLRWTPQPLPIHPADPAGWAILGTPECLAGARHYPDLSALLDHPDHQPRAVLYAPPSGTPVREAVHSLLSLLQQYLTEPRLADVPLTVLTRHAHALDPGDPVDPAHAALWGLTRTAQTENPDRIHLLDTDDDPTHLAQALTTATPQLALRDTTLHTPHLVPLHEDPPLSAPRNAGTWRLDTREPGTIESLELVPCEEMAEPLAPGTVRVAVRAAGLNFRDVLMALGMYPGERVMGSEGAGVVTEVGPGVTGLEPGDRVLGLLPHSFGPVAVADERLLVRMPEGWTFARGASVPVVFLTAYYGLRDLGGLEEGDAVLVHAAAGGVGMAAVQLARHWGAQVYATAGPAKQRLLREMGLAEERIASSRDLEFAERFLHESGGGMRVVLNSLAREFVDASLRLLPEGGRFIEMGKTDIRDAAEVAARHPGVTYQAFDLMEAGPDRIRQMLGEIVALLEAGVLDPLPVRSWDIHRAPEVYRFMSQARHVGKIVLTVPSPPDPDGTFLVTGGTGALGAQVARHLVEAHGVRQLLLTSRRGLDAPGAAGLRDELTRLGASVTVTACDVSRREDVARLLAGVPDAHPLTAVVHAAGVTADGTLEALDADAVDRVLDPKVTAAGHLDELTRHLDLSRFVLFSSIAGTLGTAGQGNYAAANAGLDALAQRRRALGHPALSLGWGYWAQESELSGHLGDADVARLSRSGILPLATDEGLALFDAAMALGEAVVVPARLGTRAERGADVPAVLSKVVRPVARRAAGTDGSVGRDRTQAPQLAALAPAERAEALVRLVRTHAAVVLGHESTDTVPRDATFKTIGFDSLASVELRNRLNSATGLRLSATAVFDNPTPEALAELLGTQLPGTAAEDGPTPGTESLAALEGQLATGALGEEERSRFAKRLKSLLWQLEDTPPDAAVEGDGADAELSTASDEEMFALIDRELGRG